MFVEEMAVNETKNHLLGNPEVYEPFTEDRGRLFRHYQKAYGRCTSAVYVDLPTGARQKVGWMFSKRVLYDDAEPSHYFKDKPMYQPEEYFVRAVWVTLLQAKPVTETHYQYVTLPQR